VRGDADANAHDAFPRSADHRVRGARDRLADLEFTDAAGVVHAIEIDDYRQVTEHGCCIDLVVIGADAQGPFVASFMTQGGLPDDCYVENDPGVDRGSHVEILGILWRKSPGFAAKIPYGTGYTPGTRFCFDEHGQVASIVAP
jgi:hypothetical protein